MIFLVLVDLLEQLAGTAVLGLVFGGRSSATGCATTSPTSPTTWYCPTHALNESYADG